MSITKEILNELWNTSLHYKGMQINIFGIPKFNNYSKRTLRSTIDRLAKNGMIEKEISGIILSPKGKEYVKKKIDSLKSFDKPRNSSGSKNLLVIFDMPIHKKAEREWFRWHIKKFGYIMIQQSVWVGPSPLPKEFLDYIKKINLKDCIKTFKLAKSYADN